MAASDCYTMIFEMSRPVGNGHGADTQLDALFVSNASDIFFTPGGNALSRQTSGDYVNSTRALRTLSGAPIVAPLTVDATISFPALAYQGRF